MNDAWAWLAWAAFIALIAVYLDWRMTHSWSNGIHIDRISQKKFASAKDEEMIEWEEYSHELGMCALVNLKNLEEQVPSLLQHPLYQVARAQLVASLGGETVDESLSKILKEEAKS